MVSIFSSVGKTLPIQTEQPQTPTSTAQHALPETVKVDLAFEGIEMIVMPKNKERVLLDGSIRGRAQPGRMLAIMGPSGAVRVYYSQIMT